MIDWSRLPLVLGGGGEVKSYRVYNNQELTTVLQQVKESTGMQFIEIYPGVMDFSEQLNALIS